MIFSYFYQKSYSMKINGQHYHTIWVKENNPSVIQIIDQRQLPFEFKILDLKTIEDTYNAIKDMWVRGAPLIGVTAAYGMYLGLLSLKNDATLKDKITEKKTIDRTPGAEENVIDMLEL